MSMFNDSESLDKIKELIDEINEELNHQRLIFRRNDLIGQIFIEETFGDIPISEKGGFDYLNYWIKGFLWGRKVSLFDSLRTEKVYLEKLTKAIEDRAVKTRGY